MRTKLATILLIVATVVASCSNNEERPNIRSQELSGELTIALNYDSHSTSYVAFKEYYETSDRHAYMPIHNRILKFIERHPKVTVKIIDTEWNNIFLNHLLHDSPPEFTVMPDIIELTPHQVRWMASKVGMEELSFYIENMLDGLDWGQEYKALMEKANVDGKTYLLPVSSDPLVAFYNAPIFKTLDVQPPSEGWTWDDFLSLAYRLKDEGHIIGVLRSMSGGNLISVDNIEPIIKSLGGQYISPDASEFTGYLNSPATEQAFELYIKHFSPLLESNMLWSFSQIRAGLEFPALGFGRASQMYRLLDQIDPLEKLNPVNRGYELVQMPSMSSGERFNTSLVSGLAMTNVARDKGLAWELMQFIVGEDNEHPMQLVTSTPIMVAERRFSTRPPERLNELLRLIRTETNEATISSLAMVPTSIYSNVYHTDPSQNQFNLWRLELDEDLSDAELTNEVRSYLIDLLESLENMRDEMIEKGFVFPQRNY